MVSIKFGAHEDARPRAILNENKLLGYKACCTDRKYEEENGIASS